MKGYELKLWIWCFMVNLSIVTHYGMFFFSLFFLGSHLPMLSSYKSSINLLVFDVFVQILSSVSNYVFSISDGSWFAEISIRILDFGNMECFSSFAGSPFSIFLQQLLSPFLLTAFLAVNVGGN